MADALTVALTASGPFWSNVHLPAPAITDPSRISHVIEGLKNVPLFGCLPFRISPPYSTAHVSITPKEDTVAESLNEGLWLGEPKQRFSLTSMANFKPDAWIYIALVPSTLDYVMMLHGLRWHIASSCVSFIISLLFHPPFPAISFLSCCWGY